MKLPDTNARRARRRTRPSLLVRAVVCCVILLSGCGYFGPAEKATLTEACSAADARIMSVLPSLFLTKETAGTAVVSYEGNRFGLLTMPGCKTTQLPHSGPEGQPASAQVLPQGTRLFGTMARDGTLSFWFAADAGAALNALPAAAFGPNEFPKLSEDGRWAAVLRTFRSAGDTRNEIVLKELGGSAERRIWPAGVEWSWHELVAINAAKEEVVLARGLREYLWVSFDGRTIRGPVNTLPVQAQPTTFRWVGDGWFAWDAYRESGPYSVRLALSTRNFTKSFEKLRRISHAAVSPDGRFVAASLETEYGRVLSLRDAVVVYDTLSGEEIFRKYLPRFTRTDVAFLGNGFLAYGEANRVRVLQLPR